MQEGTTGREKVSDKNKAIKSRGSRCATVPRVMIFKRIGLRRWCGQAGALRCVNVNDKLRAHTGGLMATGSLWWTHIYIHTHTSLITHFRLNSHANVRVCEILKHFPQHDMPLVSGRISVILLKCSRSCNFPSLGDRMSPSEREGAAKEWHASWKERRSVYFHHHCVHKAKRKHFYCNCVLHEHGEIHRGIQIMAD